MTEKELELQKFKEQVSQKTRHVRLGEYLVSTGALSPEHLSDAINKRHDPKYKDRRFGELLIELGYSSEIDVTEALSVRSGIPLVQLSMDMDFDYSQLSDALCRQHHAVCFAVNNGTAQVAVRDPFDYPTHQKITSLLKNVNFHVAPKSQIEEVLQTTFDSASQIEKNAVELESTFKKTDTDITYNDESHTKRFLDALFDSAVQKRATDIHIEPFEDELTIRFRIDGELYKQASHEAHIALPVTQKLRIMADINIVDQRSAFDGEFTFQSHGKQFNVRINITPTAHGPSSVIRILDGQKSLKRLDQLDVHPEDAQILREALHKNQGMIIVTGPTGGGKTTTLYSGLLELDAERKKIITLENPVEVKIKGISQCPITDHFTFSKGLRSLLRQDPDVILVGEIRDSETATTALEAASTGHLVLTTVHTNDAMGAVARLKILGGDLNSIASNVLLMTAQRLLRKVCKSCSTAVEFTAQERSYLTTHGYIEWESYANRRGSGKDAHGRTCTLCNGTGYHGRQAVHEMLLMNRELRNSLNFDGVQVFEQKARAQLHKRTLRDRAVQLALNGVTTLEEAISNTQEDQ